MPPLTDEEKRANGFTVFTDAEKHTRRLIALQTIDAVLSTLEGGISNAKTAAQLAKIRRWHGECVATMPKDDPKSASVRLAKKAQKDLHARLQSKMADDSISTGEAYTARAYISWCVFLGAFCICPHSRTKPWQYLDKTLLTLCKGFIKQYPRGEDLGHAVYMEVDF